MHDYLRAIGFSCINNKEDLNKIIRQIEDSPDEDVYTDDGEKPVLGEKSKYFADRMGITVCGEYDSHGKFIEDCYFPYFVGREVSLVEEMGAEKQADKDTYVGVCDNINVDTAIIFHLLNAINFFEYTRYMKQETQLPIRLSGLSLSGKILLPIMKTKEDIEKSKLQMKKRGRQIEAARSGDPQAIESLTLENLDLYSALSKRVRTEDVLSIVETYFMPYGIAADQYELLGNILDVQTVTNTYSGETIYILSLECNHLLFDVCINSIDLLGEPKKDRRFKGIIWLQGSVDFRRVLAKNMMESDKFEES